MLALAHSAAMLGIDGYVVRVEADSSPGTPAFSIIGLPDRALAEARDRVRAAIFNCGFGFPAGRLLINLSPADIRKEGPEFDLAIALALLGWGPILIALGIVVVPSGMAGVRVSQTKGTLAGTLYPGIHFVTPLAESVALFDTRDQLFTTGMR